jgi:TetR/AcrR family transcriptional regulator, lmrAB and yxaGH operons repressor
MTTRATDKGRQTRDRMLRTAAKLFTQQGYDGTGLQEIIERSGAPRGSLYFHFPGGKQELAVATVNEAGLGIGRGIELMLAAHEDVGEAVAAVVELTAANLERSGFRDGCPIAAVTHDAAAGDDEVRSACGGAFAYWQGLLEARLRRAGWSRRRARDDALVLLAAIEGGITLGRAGRSTEALGALARRCRADLTTERARAGGGR